MIRSRISSGRINKGFAAAGLLAVMLAGIAFSSYAAEVSVSWNNVSLSSDGDCSYSIGDTGSLVVDKYELKLARKSSGSWNTNYKTAKTSDNSYSFSFSSTGQYYYNVRALFVGGDKSTWSQSSNTVSVSSEDVSHDSTPNTNIYIQTNGGNGSMSYQGGPGGGNSSYTYTTTTIGPDGKTVTTTYGANGSVASQQVGPGNTPLSPSNTTGKGWIRSGNSWIYIYANGTQPKNVWDRIDNKWYYFDANGYLKYGWIDYNGARYYSDINTGEMKTGFNFISGKWYYFNEGGKMQTGYITLDGKMYYCDQSGARVDSGYNPDGHQFDVNGVMIK